MNPVTCSALLLLAALLVQAAPTDDHWTVFKQEHGHHFSDIESRKEAYLAAKAVVDKHNAEAEQGLHPYTMAVYPHSIMTAEEKKGMYGNIDMVADVSDLALEHIDSGVAAPASLDLRTNKCMGPVQDQNPCGSCYAFSTVAPIDYQYCQLKKLAAAVPFSPQQIVDCSQSVGNNGCSGGGEINSYQYIQKVGGIMTQANYPYTAKVGQCAFNATKAPLAKVQSIVPIRGGPNAVSQMKDAINTYGPISIALIVSQKWEGYKGGVFVGPCTPSMGGHAVTAVGWGTDAATGVQYWIVRNQWNTWWGEKGYIRHQLGIDLCNIESRQTVYPIITA